MSSRRAATTSASVTALCGAVAITAYAALGALQILVLNPLAVAPGHSLAQIHARIRVANESLATSWVLTLMGIGVGLGVLILVLALRRSSTSSESVVLSLFVLAFGAPAYWVASLPAGMSLADTFATSGGDHAPWAIILYLVSAGSVAGLVATGVQKSRATRVVQATR